MLKPLLLAATLALVMPVHAKAPPTLPLAQAAKAGDGTELRTRARVVEALGKNKFIVSDGATRLEVKGGPDWYHSLPLKAGETYVFDGALKVKDKDGERKTELKLVRVWRADGAVIVLRKNAADEPWKTVDRASASAPKPLVWHIPNSKGAKS